MRVALLARDLIISSKVAAAAELAGVELQRFDDPAKLPMWSEIELLLVDWGDRRPGWDQRLIAWHASAPQSQPPRMVLFGPHRDLAAHRDARATGLGPMRARSKLLAELSRLFS